MNQSKVRFEVNVPFSWEKKPGVCKAVAKANNEDDDHHGEEKQYGAQMLPPPPCRSESARFLIHEIPILFPPRPFQSHSFRSSPWRGPWRYHDDPFFAAYKECTRGSLGSGKAKKEVGGSWFRVGNVFKLSCKQSCSVRDDNLLRVPRTWHQRYGDCEQQK